MDIGSLVKRLGQVAIDNSPKILTTAGVVGTITTAYLAGKASFEAADMIRLKEGLDYQSEEDRREPREVLKDRIQLVAKLYIPAVTVGAASVVCIIFANQVGARRAAGMAAAFSISEKAAEEYRDKVRDKFGNRKEEQVRDEIQQDRVTAKYNPGVEIYGPPEGHLCYDKYSDRFFRSTVEGIKGAQNDFNYTLLNDGYASVGEFYANLGLPGTGYSEIVGWNSAVKLEVVITSTLTPLDEPCIAIDFREEPFPEYGRTFRRG